MTEQAILHQMSDIVGSLSVDIVDVAGNVDEISKRVADQSALMSRLKQHIRQH
jgi:hypothetical protein